MSVSAMSLAAWRTVSATMWACFMQGFSFSGTEAYAHSSAAHVGCVDVGGGSGEAAEAVVSPHHSFLGMATRPWIRVWGGLLTLQLQFGWLCVCSHNLLKIHMLLLPLLFIIVSNNNLKHASILKWFQEEEQVAEKDLCPIATPTEPSMPSLLEATHSLKYYESALW